MKGLASSNGPQTRPGRYPVRPFAALAPAAGLARKGNLRCCRDKGYRYRTYRRIELCRITAQGYNPPRCHGPAAQRGEAGMHTVELLERLKELAAAAGYAVRHEWLGGVGGGACEFAGRKWIFVDLSLSVVEQLDQVATALRGDPVVPTLSPSAPVERYLGLRRAA